MKQLKFIIEWAKEKKISLSVILALLIILLIIPTGFVDDLLMTVFLVKIFGWKVYLFIVGVLIVILATIVMNNKKVKSMLKNPGKKEVFHICKNLYKKPVEIENCVRRNQ